MNLVTSGVKWLITAANLGLLAEPLLQCPKFSHPFQLMQTNQTEYFSGLIKLISEYANLGYLSLHLHTSLLPETNTNYYPEVSVPNISETSRHY
jgi:hypothetical protein